MPRSLLMLTLVLTLGGVSGHCLAQASVRMRPVAKVTSGANIVLRDVATVDGASAEHLRELVVWSATTGAPRPTSLTPQSVRKILEENGQNMGRITVSGGEARIELGLAEAAPLAQPAASPATGPEPVGSTVRGVIPATIAAHLGVAETDLQLDYDDADAAALATSIANRTHTVAPMGKSDRQSLHVRVYEGDTLVVAKTVRVGVLVRRSVAVAVANIERQTPITPALVASEERWIAPSASVVSPDEVVGHITKARIDAGKAVESRHLAEQLAVRKGETVVVDCLSGGVVVRAQMRARTDAKIGDVIEFAPLASDVTGREKTRQRASAKTNFITARVAGPGKAVMVVAGQDPK